MSIPKILIIGATGNVGQEVIKELMEREEQQQVIVGVRDIEKGRLFFGEYTELQYRLFDFEDTLTFASALEDVDRVFVLRPPSLVDIPRYFEPLVQAIKVAACQRVVFLSVLGAEKSSLIPHNKIERLIKRADLPYVFVRPSYFMQNLTTTLYQDIRDRRKIVLPAGNAIFNWIDTEDIGKAVAIMLTNPALPHHKVYELTGSENLDFYQATEILNRFLRWRIRYRAMNPILFYWRKRRENYPKEYAFMVTLIHFLQRFEKKPKITNDYHELTGESPSLLQDFAKRNAPLLNIKGNDV